MKANKLRSKKSYEITRKGYLHLRRFLLVYNYQSRSIIGCNITINIEQTTKIKGI